MVKFRLSSKDNLMASLLGLQVQGVGRGIKSSGHFLESEKRTLNTFAIVYLDGGAGVFESPPTGLCEIRTGCLFFLFPGVWHRYGPRKGEEWKEYWFLFDGFIPDRYRRSGLLDPARPFYELGYDDLLVRRWKECLYLAEVNHPGTSQLLAEKLFAVLGHIFIHARTTSATVDRSAVIERIVSLMEQDLAEPAFALEDYAPDLGFSYSALRKLFKNRVGHSPARYFARMKMQVAKSRLLTSRDSVKQIGLELGFYDPYHFSRRFKELMGVSPDTFRRSFSPQ